LAREVVLIDVADGIPQGKGLDQWESAPIEGFDTRVIGSTDYEAATGSEIFIVTAGIARKPGMSRDDLLRTNAGIVRSVSTEIARVAPESIIIVVSNPLDVMSYVAMEASGFPKERVLGMAGVLDTARFRSFIALELNVGVEDIQALVLGGHGDTMVPLVNYTSVSGIPLTQLLAQDRIDSLIERTRNGGAEIVAFLKTGSAYYAPSSAAVQMADAIVKDKNRILPCAAYLEGEYGESGIFLGVPCKLGASGLKEIVQVQLTDAERAELKKSAQSVRSTMAALS
jgi:malate dehydrogenase